MKTRSVQTVQTVQLTYQVRVVNMLPMTLLIRGLGHPPRFLVTLPLYILPSALILSKMN